MRAAGEVAPSFELKDGTGTPVALKDVLAKGPALLAFFKSTCPVCQLTLPYLQRMSEGGTLQFVGISQDEPRDTNAFNERFGVRFPTLLDPRAEGYQASNAFGISTVPSLFLVEPDGRISIAVSGFSKKDMEALGERAGVQPFQPGERVPDFRPG